MPATGTLGAPEGGFGIAVTQVTAGTRCPHTQWQQDAQKGAWKARQHSTGTLACLRGAEARSGAGSALRMGEAHAGTMHHSGMRARMRAPWYAGPRSRVVEWPTAAHGTHGAVAINKSTPPDAHAHGRGHVTRDGQVSDIRHC